MAKGTWKHYFLPRIYPKPKSRQADYQFELDLLGEKGGFIKHNRKNDRIRVYLDSNGDDIFNKGDMLIKGAKVRKKFRSTGELIDIMEIGKVNSKLIEKCHTLGGIDPCFASLLVEQLTFRNSDGDLVAKLEVPPLFG